MQQKNDWFKDSIDSGNAYRQLYVDSLENLIENFKKQAETPRKQKAKEILENSEKCREEYGKILGFPLNKPIDHTPPKVTMTYVGEDSECKIYRCQIEVFSNFQFYGILFLTDENEKKPLVISQHGGWGTPELCSSFVDSSNYNDMTRRILKTGVNVFAPQLVLWKQEGTVLPRVERQELDSSLRQFGSSITAIEVYSIIKSLDYFVTQKYVDPDKIGMAGLSYGGYYTLQTAAMDTRIKSAVACSHFNDRLTYSWNDYCYKNSGFGYLDSEVALLIKPRKLQILVGDNDELFDDNLAKKEFDRIKEYDKDYNDWAYFEVFEGIHEFYFKDDKPIEKMVKDLLG